MFGEAAAPRRAAGAPVGRRARGAPRPGRDHGGRPCGRPLCQPDHLGRRADAEDPRRPVRRRASTTCRSRSRTASRPPPTTSPDTGAAYARKRSLADEVVRLGLPLTVNAVMHRANIDRVGAMVELALALGAGRVEIAHVQYYGWALKNRAALMPTRRAGRARAGRGRGAARAPSRAHRHRRAWCPTTTPAIPSPAWAAGAGARSTSRPSGRVLPCHAAESIPGLEFWSVRDHSLADIWRNSPAFQRLPRHRLDARAVPELPAPGARISAAAAARPSCLTGDARADRPGLPPLAPPWRWWNSSLP